MARPVLLVHGAWHGPWCWAKVIDALRERGVDVHATELHRGSVEADTAAVQADVNRLSGGDGVIVCGHSYGGVVISGLAPAGVAHLVYLCAFMPHPDDAGMFGGMAAIGGSLQKAIRLDPERSETTIDPSAAPDAFYGDCSEEDVAFALARLRPQSAFDLQVPIPRACWTERPSTYVVCSEDQAVPVELQRELAKRATATVTWRASHSPFLSMPAQVAELLADLAEGQGVA